MGLGRKKQNMKKIQVLLLISLAFLGNVVLMAQTPALQTAKVSWGEDGDVIYSYYVAPNGDEVQHGSFKLTRSDKLSNGGTYLRVVDGNFKNGNKDGIWTYTHDRKDYGSNNYYATGLVKLVQTFKEGVPHGLWSYNCNLKYRELLRNGSGYSWGEYIDPELVDVSCSYNNGKISGKIIYKTDKHDFSGNFNSNGYCIGDWLIREGAESTRFTSKNGFLTMYNQKGVNATLSEVIDFTPQVISMIDSLSTGTLSIGEVPKRGLQVDTVKLSSIVMDLYTYMNGAQYFPMHLVGKGDKTYKDGYSSERSYGEFIVIKPLENIVLDRLREYNELRSSHDHVNAINALVELYYKYEKRLSDPDKILLINEIESRKSRFAEQLEEQEKAAAIQKEKEVAEEYKTLYLKMTKMTPPSSRQKKENPPLYSNIDFTEFGYKDNQREPIVAIAYDDSRFHEIRLRNIKNDEISITKIKEYISYLQQFQK